MPEGADARHLLDEFLAPMERVGFDFGVAIHDTDGSRFIRIEFYLGQDQARKAAGIA